MNRRRAWHVDNLTLKNFRSFENLNLDFDPTMTVLVGVNGVGKTAILDSVAIMMSTVLKAFNGPTRGFTIEDARIVPHDVESVDSVARVERAFPISATLRGTLDDSVYEWTRVRQSESGRTSWGDGNSGVGKGMEILWDFCDEVDDSPVPLPVIALYGVERLFGVRKASGEISTSRSGAYDAALDGKSDSSRLAAFIKALTFAEFIADKNGGAAKAASAQLEAIRLACNEMLQTTGWRNPVWSPLLDQITLTHDGQGTIPLSFLSSGIRITAGLTVDLVSRMARANPSLGAKELLESVPGIVLIDEIDLHLHPVWQQRIMLSLRHVFPNVQFIVTTHSPQVLSTVDAGCIRVIDGNEVHRVNHSAGLRSDVVLEQILGVTPEPHLKINEDLRKYMDLVDSGKGRSELAKKLRKRLDEELGGVLNVHKLADADVSIALDDWED